MYTDYFKTTASPPTSGADVRIPAEVYYLSGFTIMKGLLFWIFLITTCAVCVGRYNRACIQALCSIHNAVPSIFILFREDNSEESDVPSEEDSNELSEVSAEHYKPPSYPAALRMPRPEHPSPANTDSYHSPPAYTTVKYTSSCDALLHCQDRADELPSYREAVLLSSLVYNHQSREYDIV
eukprot:GHVU01030833.1.p1 GENE.GHVU01030833.1~~GHVU01030833.1.p1  ORF type:complete len:181 (-),score=10.32 GHVU01030833.1:34-576(-)